jgi:hypothetical protein
VVAMLMRARGELLERERNSKWAKEMLGEL